MDDPPKKPPFAPVPIQSHLLIAARSLRQNMTDAEHFLWYFLRRNQLGGFHFRRQHPVGPFKLDFYCSAARLCVELDGGQHTDQAAKDATRTRFLKGHGIEVVRIWNHELFENTQGALERIYQAVVARRGEIRR
jgi:very-short-patch-repair endonuclease